ncbi:hypothetical protein [Bradyrhizobium sp. CCBAU 45384]|nr:hypothetical protein [Bradyrhizobium sp. CCBAU 45384]
MGEGEKKEFVERVRLHFQEITPQPNKEMEMIAECHGKGDELPAD